MPSVTIKDVARLANVSTATVSRVVNKDPGVSAETVERVRAAIRECRYVPNAMARNLKSDSTKTIGLIVSDIANSHFTQMAKAIEGILREQGYAMFICGTDDEGEQEFEYLSRMESARVDGLILNTTSKNNEYIAMLSERLPIVLVDRSIEHQDFIGDFVGSNNQAGIETLVSHLINNGHSKIGYIRSNQNVSTNRERLVGFSRAMKGIGITVDERYPYRFDSAHMNFEGGYQGCKHLMSADDRPTAIIVANNTLALGVWQYLRSNEILVPDDVSVLSYGNIGNSDLFFIRPGFVTLNPQFIGEKAAHYLLSRISQPQTRNREAIFEPSLMPNDSVKRI